MGEIHQHSKVSPSSMIIKKIAVFVGAVFPLFNLTSRLKNESRYDGSPIRRDRSYTP